MSSENDLSVHLLLRFFLIVMSVFTLLMLGIGYLVGRFT